MRDIWWNELLLSTTKISFEIYELFSFYLTHQGNTNKNWQCFTNLTVVWKTSKEEDKDSRKFLKHDRRPKHISPTQIFQINSTCFNDKWLKMCMVTHFKQLFFISGKLIGWITWRRLYQKLKWRGNHKTTWCLYLNILPLYNTTEEDLFILQAFYFVMESQNISFLLGNNLEYLKKILCLLVCHQECTKIFIPFASCSMLTKCSFVCNFSNCNL